MQLKIVTLGSCCKCLEISSMRLNDPVVRGKPMRFQMSAHRFAVLVYAPHPLGIIPVQQIQGSANLPGQPSNTLREFVHQIDAGFA